jgi:hypothetical protein
MAPHPVKSVLITRSPDILFTHYQDNVLNSNTSFVVYVKRGNYRNNIKFSRNLNLQKTIYSVNIFDPLLEFVERAERSYFYPEILNRQTIPENHKNKNYDHVKFNRDSNKQKDLFIQPFFREENLEWNEQQHYQLSLSPQVQMALVKFPMEVN